MTKEELAGLVAGALKQITVVASVEVLPENLDVVGVEMNDGSEFFLEVQEP